MSHTEAQRWKEKYLQALERQEQLEERWEARLDLLRRSLVRSSFAVEGGDPAVERCMQQLRAVLREGDLDDGLSALVPRLESAVLNGERERHERVARLIGELQRLVEQLLALTPPNEVRKSLKRYARQAEKRAAQASELPALLGELAGLQAQTLAVQDSSEKRADGLLQRLFGHGQRTLAEQVAEAPVPQVAEPHAETTETVQVVCATTRRDDFDWSLLLDQLPMPAALFDEPEPAAPQEAEEQPAADAAPDEGHYALPMMSEQAYSAIAEHVQATLFGLLDDLQLPESHGPQAAALRERVERGLNWYELVPVLDDLAVLMRAATSESQREFENYLQSLNERLSTMQDNLSAAHEGVAQSQEAARVLDDELRQHVGGLRHSVLEANDLASLKQAVRTRLDGLLATADAYQQRHSQHESQLGERLQQLVGRVTSLEQAASGLRQRLEEQRQLALVDTLTELPNRAAWDERLEVEVARWQRYGGELLLAVLDVDHFKCINDDFGHLAGDRVLKIIAGELRKRLRKTDFIARFGGEEFALLLPHTPLPEGLRLLDTLRQGIEQCPFHFKGEPVTVTLSGGLGRFAEGETLEQVFERADHALYAAKDAGRNRIELGLTERL
ncbi:diguanylate cyclase [Stutzerimonas stutzeri DSM 10701]|uniref:GGDEF domain-containing protein n=1 Tax=Stutzerimonas nitrititolerans TaxID=2482751 RepID=UPI00026D724C|nr:GGDEF domain-containing protein [Stutzerimonas nitrititolerans]AFN79664.1 diguanylate cyclase [Stutzerimonas stutzeri DSM 10701]SUD86189.1 diguanylate cyclase [Stutzerimonas stutzeri]